LARAQLPWADEIHMVPSYPDDFRLYLASSSPRRSVLLAAAGVPFEVVETDAEEEDHDLDPHDLARRNALAKARGAQVEPAPPAGSFVLGADTVVVVDDSILGKPEGVQEARSMLELLSGRTHDVITGVALLRLSEAGEPPAEWSAACATLVHVRALGSAELQAYLDTGEWRGKAGAYAIQGIASLLVQGIQGDHSNVVGLPLSLVGDLLREAGFDPVRRAWLR
jgi:septum formation protein